ncbi:MAG: hypothetical protein ACP5IX_00825 [Patescibacteria group bacterium]
MAKILDQLSQLIAQSSIPLSDQNDLLIFLPILPEPVLNKLLEVFQKDLKLIEDFNDNFKAKVNILINGRDRWEKLVAQEEEMLRQEEDEEEGGY